MPSAQTFSVLPLGSCWYVDGMPINSPMLDCHPSSYWKPGISGVASYHISPTIIDGGNGTKGAQLRTRDTCDNPLNTTGEIKITQVR